MTIYKDGNQPTPIRVDAAKAAIRLESALSSVDAVVDAAFMIQEDRLAHLE